MWTGCLSPLNGQTLATSGGWLKRTQRTIWPLTPPRRKRFTTNRHKMATEPQQESRKRRNRNNFRKSLQRSHMERERNKLCENTHWMFILNKTYPALSQITSTWRGSVTSHFCGFWTQFKTLTNLFPRLQQRILIIMCENGDEVTRSKTDRSSLLFSSSFSRSVIREILPPPPEK